MLELEISKYEEELLMDAARIPVLIRPQKKLGKRILHRNTKIFSAEDWVKNSDGKQALPKSPMHIAQVRDITSQVTAITLDAPTSLGLLIPIKRTKTCGIPKYPRPQAKPEKIAKEASVGCAKLPSCNGLAELLKDKKPGMSESIDATCSTPPTEIIVPKNTTTKAVHIKMLCIKSVVHTLK